MKVKKDTDENPVGHNETGVEDPEGAERKNPIQIYFLTISMSAQVLAVL